MINKMANYNTYEFGVRTSLDGNPLNLHVGAEALDLLNLSIWPDRPWIDNIPVLAALPPQKLYDSAWHNYPADTPPFRDEPYDCLDNSIPQKQWKLYFRNEEDLIIWNLIKVIAWTGGSRYPVGSDNPAYPLAIAANDALMANYLIAMQTQYPTVKLVLMGFLRLRTGQQWVEINDNSDGQWMGYIKRTILNTKEYAIQQMLK